MDNPVKIVNPTRVQNVDDLWKSQFDKEEKFKIYEILDYANNFQN